MKYNKEDNKEITERLLQWIIDDKQAFSVVENSKFKHFIEGKRCLYVTG